MDGVKVGFAMCGSFCTFARALEQMKLLAQTGYEVVPIMSETAYSTDTRFGKAAEHIERLRRITGNEIIHEITTAEL